jgi:AraC-like DNA-binding protein
VPTGIRIGSMSLFLMLGMLHGLLVGSFLVRAKRNRLTNRLLAALLFVSVLRLLPFAIGYAGFYDAYPWLSFAPWNLSLAFGPLIYLYLRSLTQQDERRGVWIHFLPVSFQFLYFFIMFLQPLRVKESWDDSSAGIAVGHTLALLTVISATTYLGFAIRQYFLYEARLQNNVSFADDLCRPLLRNVLLLFSALMLIWTAYTIADLFHPISYFAVFPMYVVLTGFVYVLGMEGWRHANAVYPQMELVAAVPSGTPTKAPLPSSPSDWKQLGTQWTGEIERRELWRDPELTAASLARLLGTNTTYLSRALNDGLGQKFNECVNRYRVGAVREAISSGDDRNLLDIALECGFRSKASFNRTFKAMEGRTPSSLRESFLAPGTSQIPKVVVDMEDGAHRAVSDS